MEFNDSIYLILNKKGTKIYSVASGATVYEALVIMAEKGIGALCVIDGEKLVGIFSERDYARRVILVGRSSKEMKISEIMTSPVTTVRAEATVDECMQHMTAKHCRHLPVVDSEDKVIAMLSIGDLVNWIISSQKQTIEHLEGYISGPYPG